MSRPSLRVLRGFGIIALGLHLSIAAPLFSQSGSDSTLCVDQTTAETGDQRTVTVSLDHIGMGLAGWTYGLCSPPAELALDSVADGIDVATLKNGLPPDFQSLETFEGGFTTATVICFTSCATLPAGLGYSIKEATYDVVGLAPATGTLSFCETLGDPPVTVRVVDPGGSTLEPITIDGGIEITGPDPLRFRFTLGTVEALYDPGNGESAATLPVTLLEEPDSAGSPNPVTGFVLALGHDDTFITATGALPGLALAQTGGGAGPDTFLVDLHPGGIVVSATVDISDPWFATLPQDAVTVLYDSVPSSLAFNFFGLDVAISGDPDITSPPTPSSVLSPPVLPVGVMIDGGGIEFRPRLSFRRGDANDDGALDIGDALAVLGWLFAAGSISCLDAGDANDDGGLDIGDAIYILGYLFSGTPGPPPPHPTCGFDPDGDLGCNIHVSCP